ncbi:MAG: DUF4142 domain-containing protein [Myxococcales bacterium]|nr:MAG: DUF4142 domain-containing protein [Myxococcales bacterium]
MHAPALQAQRGYEGHGRTLPRSRRKCHHGCVRLPIKYSEAAVSAILRTGGSGHRGGTVAANWASMNRTFGHTVPALIGTISLVLAGCAGDQKAPPTQAEVANGEALPTPPPVPAQPASTDSPATAPAPVVEQASATQPSPPGDAAATPEKETLTEAQVAQFADLANGSEVEQGKVAQSKAKAPAVKKFADMMVKHHTEAQQEQAKLFKKLNVTPADSASSAALKADGEKSLASLKEASAADFDRTYMTAQVDAHQKVLQAIDEKLLPVARTPELQAALRKMRATVEAHLTQAKTLQGQVGK